MRRVCAIGGAMALAGAACGRGEPVVVVESDDVEITSSCVVRIPAGTVIADENGDGVIRIVGDGVEVTFEAGSALVGVPGLDTWERTQDGAYQMLTGTGIVIEGAGVTVRGAEVRGYRVGIAAEGADGLTLEGVRVEQTYHPPLGSTPWAEDAGDWLSPHANDNGEWVDRYGAAVSVRDATGVTLDRVRVRRSQNGIVLDRVDGSRVFDCDASFLSGWGLAMWRSSGNTVSRNRFDYNIRGHSEGVYNRGQDSAGILMFEQCRDNVIAENSATHGGDGVFAFAGQEAIGQVGPKPEGLDYLDAGINGNVFLGNDLSYASAHGLELTFSENNVVAGNRFVENAICGIWGGYSSGIRVHGNEFVRNGGMPYGAEGGGINAEHASGWLIDGNSFVNNRTAVHFWTDHDVELMRLPGVSPGYRGVDGNAIVRNRFVLNDEHPFGEGAEGLSVVRARRELSTERGTMPFGTNWLMENEWEVDEGVGLGIWTQSAGFERPSGKAEDVVWFSAIPEPELFGTTRPTETPVHPLVEPGRGSIVMGRWRAWDFESVLLREAAPGPGGGEDGVRRFELYVPRGVARDVSIEYLGGPAPTITRDGRGVLDPIEIEVRAQGDSPAQVALFRLTVKDRLERTMVVPLVRLDWRVRAWAWGIDPVEDREAWRAEGAAATPVTLGSLDLAFGYAGPAGASERLGGVEAGERFGLIAETSAVLPVGAWSLQTLSDDGVRVEVNGEVVIDRWNVHGPTPDAAVFQSDGETPTTIRVEYFENTGYAVLRVGLSPAG
ncbi:MAG: right-handed parallel beta-helix repeat-containing protein [Phycisphaerales bacterium JB040]